MEITCSIHTDWLLHQPIVIDEVCRNTSMLIGPFPRHRVTSHNTDYGKERPKLPGALYFSYKPIPTFSTFNFQPPSFKAQLQIISTRQSPSSLASSLWTTHITQSAKGVAADSSRDVFAESRPVYRDIIQDVLEICRPTSNWRMRLFPSIFFFTSRKILFFKTRYADCDRLSTSYST